MKKIILIIKVLSFILLAYFIFSIVYFVYKTGGFKKEQVIVVFKKGVELKIAIGLLKESKVKFRKGSDSSKGKQYFYKTGHKFIMTFKNRKQMFSFKSKYKLIDEVYEIYHPNWDIKKD